MNYMFIALRRSLLAFLVTGLISLPVYADSVLRDMRGNITTFDEHKTPGEWTVVMIWASDCHVCNQEAGQYSTFQSAHAGNDANILGISIDGRQGKADAEAFIKRNGVIFPSLIGDVETVARWYQLKTGESFRATPTFVLFDPQGEVRAAQPGAVPTDVIEKFIASNS
jgi:thiol-disulfide isomerase/thioredoxin